MPSLNPSIIDSWHAHVYFDASSRDAALALRETIAAEMAGRADLGRFHERPVGPHPMWSYQLAFAPARFAEVVGWLTLNHGGLDVFIHPNTFRYRLRKLSERADLDLADPDTRFSLMLQLRLNSARRRLATAAADRLDVDAPTTG